MNKERRGSSRLLFGNSIFYVVADFLSRGLHFILLPIYTIFLTTEDYGIQNIITSFNSVMCYVILLCLDSAALRFYSEYKDDKYTMKRFYGTAMSIICFFAVAVVIGCIFLQGILSKLVFKGIEFYPYVILGLTILVLDSIYTLHRRILEAQQKGKTVAVVGFLAVLFSSIITLVMIGVFKLGIYGVLIATLCTSLATVCFAVIDIKKNDMLTVCFDKILAKKMLSYSLPLIPHQISGYLATLISKIFLNTSNSLSTVGLYGIATQFSSVVDLFQDSVSRAYRPWLFEKLENKDVLQKLEIQNISTLLISLYTVIYVGLGLFAQEIILFMTASNYHSAWRVVPILVVAMSFRSVYYFYLAQCLYYTRTSNKIFIASITANLSNIVAASVLVPKYGMYGSAMASLISIVINTCIMIILNKPNGDIGYKLLDLLSRIFVSWIFIFVGIIPCYIYSESGIQILLFFYKIIVACLYLFWLWIQNRKKIYMYTETSSILELVKKIRRR